MGETGEGEGEKGVGRDGRGEEEDFWAFSSSKFATTSLLQTHLSQANFNTA